MYYVMDDVINQFLTNFTTNVPFQALEHNFYKGMIIVEVFQHDPRSFPKRLLRFACDIYDKFFILLLNNEKVEKLRCKLSGYMYGRYTLDTNPSTDGQR